SPSRSSRAILGADRPDGRGSAGQDQLAHVLRELSRTGGGLAQLSAPFPALGSGGGSSVSPGIRQSRNGRDRIGEGNTGPDGVGRRVGGREKHLDRAA